MKIRLSFVIDSDDISLDDPRINELIDTLEVEIISKWYPNEITLNSVKTDDAKVES